MFLENGVINVQCGLCKTIGTGLFKFYKRQSSSTCGVACPFLSPARPAHSDAVSCLLLLSQQGPITILVCLSRLLLLRSFPLNGEFSNDSTLQKTGRGVVQQLIQAATSSRTAGALECLSGAEWSKQS